VTYESWIKKALEQARTLHPSLADPSAFPVQGAVYFVGCTINIVADGQARAGLPAVPLAISAKPSVMQAAVRPTKTPDAHQAE
jgi:hypothetical protein